MTMLEILGVLFLVIITVGCLGCIGEWIYSLVLDRDYKIKEKVEKDYRFYIGCNMIEHSEKMDIPDCVSEVLYEYGMYLKSDDYSSSKFPNKLTNKCLNEEKN